ncbi:MAG TPA: AAA family ATPase [Chthoniobacter sp.]|jgi:general secretion pathway protein A
METHADPFAPAPESPPFPPSSPASDADLDAFHDLLGSLPTPPAPEVVPFAPAGNFMSFYGLKENPFADSVHPAFFFRTDGHAEAFRSMMLAVEFRASLGMVTGPSGTGKTLVSQLLLQQFEAPKYRVVLVLVTPGLSKTGLLREILSELDLALPVGIPRVQDLVKQLGNHIIELHEQGQRLVIIVDECHLLSADCLHMIRTISNIETPQEKLVTCLLFGEARLSQRLDHPSYASLNNRIYLRCELRSLDLPEVAQYIKFRLLTAGRLDPLFSEPALAVIHELSCGICRNVSKLAMLSLIEAADHRAAMVDENLVRLASRRM